MSNRRREETGTVEIPERVLEAIRGRLDATQFDTVDEYATVALECLLYELEADSHADAPDEVPQTRSTEGSEADIDDAEEVQDRLESLGYL